MIIVIAKNAERGRHDLLMRSCDLNIYCQGVRKITRFEPGTSQIRKRSHNHSNATLGDKKFGKTIRSPTELLVTNVVIRLLFRNISIAECDPQTLVCAPVI